MTRKLIGLFLLLAAGATGWYLLRGSRNPAGRVNLVWSGSRSGKIELPGQLAWCPVTRVATLEAVRNDTGLLMTLLENDSLTNGPRHVVSPQIREQSPRPSALASMRWVNDSGLVGFRSVSGMVDLLGDSRRLSGSFELHMQAPGKVDTITVRGDFRDLPVEITAIDCS
ncbi:MAG TPA: hypothetical protein PLL69_08480 [Gemmatimonadales bacterium]|nr:hypothetical protein [Gemmatimonadales bacterium]